MKYLIILLILLTPTLSHANIGEDKAVRCILGEARNQGYTGMLAIAEFIRKNGADRLVGCNAKIKYSEWEYLDSTGLLQTAWRAWYDSKYTDIIGDSTHFENIDIFGEPSWAYGMKKTVKINDHQFYK